MQKMKGDQVAVPMIHLHFKIIKFADFFKESFPFFGLYSDIHIHIILDS